MYYRNYNDNRNGISLLSSEPTSGSIRNEYVKFNYLNGKYGLFTTEMDLSGDDIPGFWQAFDSLTNPNVIAQGTLKLDKSSIPFGLKLFAKDSST